MLSNAFLGTVPFLNKVIPRYLNDSAVTVQ